MKLNDVLGLLKDEEIANKTLVISVDGKGNVTDFSLQYRKNPITPFEEKSIFDIAREYTEEQQSKGPYKITFEPYKAIL